MTQKKPKSSKSKSTKGSAVKKSQTPSLPGMEDRQIIELHESAMEYAEIRDERMRLNGQEVELKGRLLALMKKHQKETYKYNGVEINIVHEEENVKVKIKKQDDEAEAA